MRLNGFLLQFCKQTAIRAGYRMVDCANDYGNEGEIGKAIKELIDAGEIKRTILRFRMCFSSNLNVFAR